VFEVHVGIGIGQVGIDTTQVCRVVFQQNLLAGLKLSIAYGEEP
jgi:hypothetical protein